MPWLENAILNKMMSASVLDQHDYLDFHSTSSLKQQSACKPVTPLSHIILIMITLTHLCCMPSGEVVTQI